jgi:methionyl aminopeptidase
LRLINIARQAVQSAARQAIIGKPVGDWVLRCKSIAEKAGFRAPSKNIVGHGIGFTMHDEPQIPAWGQKGKGLTLKRGQVLCVEAQVIASEMMGVYMAEDGGPCFLILEPKQRCLNTW